MNNKLYVGNLDYGVTQDQLEDLFGQYGNVTEVVVITDRSTGRSKGFGFVTMENEEDAKSAIDELHETDFEGRKMIVNEARPKEDKGNRRSNSGGFGGGNSF